MLFEWDAAKEALNIAKHGFSFDAAQRVFDDAFCSIEAESYWRRHRELRWHALGAVPLSGGKDAVLLVVHVYWKNTHDEEITRIISTRSADKHASQ